MRVIRNLTQEVKKLFQAWRNNQNCNSILCGMDDLIDQIRDHNYQAQVKASTICRFWRAGCCRYGKDCHFKHFKKNTNPISCPFEAQCKYKVNGICNCVEMIRRKYKLSKK